jgi:hypothetical protein
MAALILPLISNKNGAVYDSTVGVISRLLQSDVAKAGDPQRASEILVRVVKREHLPRVHRITRSLKNAALRTFTQALLVSKPSRMNPRTVMTTRSSTRRLRCWLSRLVTISPSDVSEARTGKAWTGARCVCALSIHRLEGSRPWLRRTRAPMGIEWSGMVL